MAVSNLKYLATIGLILMASSAPGAVHVQAAQPITLDAQSFDGTANNVVFHKIRISQGAMSISADQGQSQGANSATRLDFDNSLWTFRGNVRIIVEQGQLAADDAEINFANQLLAKAVVNGKPAVFDGRVEKTGKSVHGRADTIAYDATKGVVRFSKEAWLSYGDSEFRGESLKYDVVAQSVVAEGAEQGSHQVHIIIPPPSAKP